MPVAKPSATSRSELSGTPPAGPVLGPEFFDRDTVAVARDLLGKVLVREVEGRRLWGRLVEVEARTRKNQRTLRGRIP